MEKLSASLAEEVYYVPHPRGEKLDMKKHVLLTDVKAVTFHMFEAKQENGKWICRVVLDV